MVNDDRLTVAQFIDNYYRPDRLFSEPGRRDRIIADRESDLRKTGHAFISRHESVTGSSVTLYDPNWRPREYLIYCAALAEGGGECPANPANTSIRNPKSVNRGDQSEGAKIRK